MTEKKNVDINLVELVNLAANILDQLFIKAPKDKAKAAFKDLKQGKAHQLGTVNFQDIVKPNLSLLLDYSEFRGPGFNLDAFNISIQGILQQIKIQFNKKGDLNILNGENNSFMVHLPGFVQIDEQLNALVMVFELGTMENIVIKLMYVDPSQYDELRKDAE
jgi:hypothetical protein